MALPLALPLTNPLHLYRALLRECTYLPDSHARTHHRGVVISSFRRYLPRDRRERKEVSLPRQLKLLRRGRKKLSVLRRANEGYLRPLQNALSETYGRKGKRRRTLMDKLMEEDVPRDSKAVEALPTTDKYSRDWKPSAMVTALLHSQDKQSQYLDRSLTGSRNLKREPAIPATNMWGRKMPEKRVKNSMRKWYAAQLTHLLPPLPEHEVERLRALSNGRKGEDEGPVSRRKGPEKGPLGLLPSLDERLLLQGPRKSSNFDKNLQGRPHHITDRLLRKIWQNIYNHTPVMTWNLEKEVWAVRWNLEGRARPLVSEAADEDVEILFAGRNT